MLNELCGDLILSRDHHPIARIAGEMLDRFKGTFGNIEVTHFAAGYEPAFNWIPLTDERLMSLLASDYEYLAFACFANECDIHNDIGLHCKMSINGFHFRRADCLILSGGFSKELASTQGALILQVWDQWAQDLHAHSGHVHDLADISEQNQEGPYWFELMGKPLPPSKLIFNPVDNEYEVDVEQNPCHRHVIGTVDFTAAWTNYLGRDFLTRLGFSSADDIVPLVKDISNEVVVLSDSLLRVTLFEDPYGFDQPENIERMWAFRRRLRIDEVAHKLEPCSFPSRNLHPRSL